MAEREGFEPSVPQRSTTDFESAAFDHSAISPTKHFYTENLPNCKQILLI